MMNSETSENSEAVPIAVEPSQQQRLPLSLLAARVLGSLIEKEFATPDLYPLTLNSLTNACNQRSNRDPVIFASSREVELALEELRKHRLAIQVVGSEARVPKFKQKLCLVYPVGQVEHAVMCELLVRGPQTAAALRANAERLCPMPESSAFEEVLRGLSELAGGPLVQKLSRQAGQKEARWVQLLTGAPEDGGLGGESDAIKVAVVIPPEVEQRFQSLEVEVAALKEQLAGLRRELGIAEA